MTRVSIGHTPNLEAYLTSAETDMGELATRTDIRSSAGPFKALPEYRTTYPRVVVEALLRLYEEYNRQFVPIVGANRERPDDYMFCIDDFGTPCNRWVQIDMVGLPQEFLDVATAFSVSEVQEVLRHYIFEIENSLAMYQLLERVTGADQFRDTFRSSLDELRERHKLPVALLAVTQEKLDAMKSSEFGVGPNETLPSETIRELSGFDALLGPDDFKRHVDQHGGRCGYLLYVRSSDPVSKLRDPDQEVYQPVLSDERYRSVAKRWSLTMNIDDPVGETNARINDTKRYMDPMDMGFAIEAEEDLIAPDYLDHIRNGRDPSGYDGDRLTREFQIFLYSCGIDPKEVVTGTRKIHCKPMQGTYGCYGHHTFALMHRKHRSAFRRDMRNRGAYVVQPEMPIPSIVDSRSGQAYKYIDRNFVTMLHGQPVFMGGFRTLLPTLSNEARKGRLHGNAETVWAPIVG